MKRKTESSSNNKRVKTEHMDAETALATIPCIPRDILLFQQNAEEDPWRHCYSASAVWSELVNPVTFVPNDHIGIINLRRLAEQSLMTAIPYNKPRQSKHLFKKVHRLLAAGPVVYAKPGTREKKLAGLVFHPGNSTLTAHVRGEANPHLGYGHQHGFNKLWEWKFVSRIDPKAMPETIAIDELPIWFDPKLDQTRRLVREEMTSILSGKSTVFTKGTTFALRRYIKCIFSALRIKFPHGAFIKPVESSCSGDFGGIITTMSTNQDNVVNTFLSGMPNILRNVSGDLQSIQSPMMRTILLSRSDPIYLIVHDLLFMPREVIGQEALKLAKTEQGSSFEVRVDFLQGQAVHSSMRYGMADYYPREIKAAANFLDAFFKKANYQNRLLCGGADIALGKDGNWHIIEFNLGAESIGLRLGTTWNCYVSNFLGRNTNLIATFEAMFEAPLKQQKKFLSGLEQSVLNHPDVDDLVEVYQWFRDRYCQLFSTNETLTERDLVLKKLKKLFSIVPVDYQDYAAALIQSARSYMDRELTTHQHDDGITTLQKIAVPARYNPTLFSPGVATNAERSSSNNRHAEGTHTRRRRR